MRDEIAHLEAECERQLTLDVESARAVLRALLEGPIRSTPLCDDGPRRYAFEGAIALDRLVAGVVNLPPLVASPNEWLTRINYPSSAKRRLVSPTDRHLELE